MRILHYLPPDNTLMAQHVAMLTASMGSHTEQHVATAANDAQTLLQGGMYDILHLHGCWRNSARNIVALARQKGTRLVLTPHGQLQPWVWADHRWSEKYPKRWFYQQHIVERAYAVIVHGRMEEECLGRLAWNHRTVTIRNAVYTDMISEAEMARQTLEVYRKVMESDPRSLMSDESLEGLALLLKAGITGDTRWLPQMHSFPAVDWHHILAYAHQERISDTINQGIRVMRLEPPDYDASHHAYFLPDGYVTAPDVGSVIGMGFATENERLIATFRQLRNLVKRQQLSMLHLIELDKELRRYECNEDALAEQLDTLHLLKLARRMMSLMQQLTGLDEGFMPVAPLTDWRTRQLRRRIERHLAIGD